MFRVLKPDSLCVSFYGWTQTDRFMSAWRAAGFRIVGHIVFRKRYASRARFVSYTHESAYVLAKGRPVLPENPPADVIDFPYSGNRLHPTQKPVAALTPLIEAFCPEGGLVLDPFCGSGSTLVAACDANCDYLGIELDRTYHRIAARRLAA
jgi:site-specific DNA-methyltransferase (adenine-specific)